MSVTSEQHVALYSVLVKGAEIDPSLRAMIREVRVLNYLRLPDLCTFTVVYPTAQPRGADSDRRPSV
jgi:hypothetical protein